MKHEQTMLKYAVGGTTHVVATCSCKWRGPERRPEAHKGDTSPWVEDWQQHKADAEAVA